MCHLEYWNADGCMESVYWKVSPENLSIETRHWHQLDPRTCVSYTDELIIVEIVCIHLITTFLILKLVSIGILARIHSKGPSISCVLFLESQWRSLLSNVATLYTSAIGNSFLARSNHYFCYHFWVDSQRLRSFSFRDLGKFWGIQWTAECGGSPITTNSWFMDEEWKSFHACNSIIRRSSTVVTPRATEWRKIIPWALSPLVAHRQGFLLYFRCLFYLLTDLFTYLDRLLL